MTLEIVTDPDRLDYDQIIPFVQNSYWGTGRSADDIRRAFYGSAAVGVFENGHQLGSARAITDGVFHAYIYDLFVFETHRGRGLAHVLIKALFAHPDLKDVESWMLSTHDTHALYEKYGFESVDPGRVMRLRRSQS